MTDAPAPRSTAGRRRAPRTPRTRWLAAGAVAALAAVLGLTLALRAGAAPACAAPVGRAAPPVAGAPALAAPPVGGVSHQGQATFYDSKGAGGNCSYPSAPANRLYVALGPSEYAAGAACGGYLDVTGPKGTVRVLVMDQCPECEPGHLDLSAEAFARIADPVRGVVGVTWRAVVDPKLAGPLTFRIKEGSSQWWFAVLVGEHGNPLRSVGVLPRGSGAFRSAVRQDYNYWLIDSGAGPGPYAIRVTDVNGHRVTATGVRLAPGETQRGTARMYGGSGSVGTPTPRPTRSSATPSPKPSRSATPSPRATTPSPPPAAVPSLVDAAVPPPAANEVRATGCGAAS
ncbi:expansin EXLX1 family cellulose-binding protein [Micromonospora sp. NPDC000089]|uniref:expansin EXLX1 family cellulose-binding protein n=1 Tax=unclassified Micromonospora TaxID=2617518 RepID=UPI0036AB2D47